MILVNTRIDLALPQGSPSNFAGTPIAFDNEKVAGLKRKTIDLAVEQFDLMDLT